MRVNKCNVSNSSCIVARELDYIDWMGIWKNLAYNQPPIDVRLFTLPPTHHPPKKCVLSRKFGCSLDRVLSENQSLANFSQSPPQTAANKE